MFHRTRKRFALIDSFPILLSFLILLSAGGARAQETGGDLSGGAGIFRPKNPEAKRSGNPARPVARPTARPTRPDPAEVEAKFEDALADGNDARDARKFPAAEAAYRSADLFRSVFGIGMIVIMSVPAPASSAFVWIPLPLSAASQYQSRLRGSSRLG